MAVYLRNKDLLDEVMRCKNASPPHMSDELVRMLYLIVDNSSRRLKYKNEEDRSDCKARAMEDCVRYWDKFDPARSTNSFAFFTQMVKFGFGKMWKVLHNPNMPTVSLDQIHGDGQSTILDMLDTYT